MRCPECGKECPKGIIEVSDGSIYAIKHQSDMVSERTKG